jgi:hypothetical protein
MSGARSKVSVIKADPKRRASETETGSLKKIHT